MSNAKQTLNTWVFHYMAGQRKTMAQQIPLSLALACAGGRFAGLLVRFGLALAGHVIGSPRDARSLACARS